MKEQKMDLKDSKILELVNNLTLTAKKRNLIKPVKDAFKKVPASKEIHKGNKEYFCN